MEDLQTIILGTLITDEPYCRKALPHLKPEYFEGPHRALYSLILDFIGKYNRLPTLQVLEIEYASSPLSKKPDSATTLTLLRGLKAEAKNDREWMLNTTERWCKDRAVFNAVMESIRIIDGKSPKKEEGMIPEILSKALSVTFDTNVGHDYLENADRRYDFYHEVEDKMPFDVEMLNTITNGGVPSKTLNVILAGTGVGKSLAMCHFASAALSMGKNVLYITLEMAEERIAERIDANLMDVRIDSLKGLSKEKFQDKVGAISRKTNGKLVIKEYPTASAHVGHFRALLGELKMKKDFTPDLVLVDYLNICASSRIKGLSGGVNTYSLIKAIAEELRGLAVEFDVPIWTATQVTRSGYNNSDVELTDTSECISISEPVEMRDGTIKTMGDIQIGDQVKANDCYKTVMFRHHNKIKSCVRIRTASGKEIVVSKDHIFPCKKTDGTILRTSINGSLEVGDCLNTVRE